MSSETKFSRLMLGTVQFGMNYGVANTAGKPTYDQVKEILKTAYDLGVTALDTAPEYGDSELVIGKALKELGLLDRFTIVTKVPILPDSVKGDVAILSFLRSSVENSLKRLGTSQVAGILLHKEGDHIYLPLLKQLEKEGLVQHAGLSANTQAYCEIARKIDFLQVPCSLLDHRFDSCLTADGGQRFIRGAYLQGMLLMPKEKIVFPEVRERREKLEALGLPMAELSMRYLLAFPANVSILTGVEKVEQLRENARVAALPPLDAETLAEIQKITNRPALSEELVSPYFWPQVKKARGIQ